MCNIPEKIINRFYEKWGDKYDYSKSSYFSYKTKILIRCKEHNEWFWQTPEMHLKFNGCKKCSSELKSKLRSTGTEEFIKKCKDKYGDEYSYDKVNYINNHTKITVTCKKHGDFEVIPSKFIDGQKCHKCTMESFTHPNKKGADEVIENFIGVHGDKYEYDVSTYTNSSSKMRIICKKHGEFFQTPNKHLNGQGCPHCHRERMGRPSYTKDTFVEKAKIIHNNKYDYSRLDFRTLRDKGVFICHKKDKNSVEHGEFIQTCNSHLSGCGCPKCANESRNDKTRKSLVEFIKEANEIHNEKYDYSHTEYVNRNTLLNIICPTHGIFSQLPNKHLRGHGCPKCAKTGIRLTKDEYIEKASTIHNGKYIYDNIEFNNVRDKIEILCPTHGYFLQEAESHLNGHGCPKCSNNISYAENEIVAFLKDMLEECEVVERDRTVLKNKEIDILLPKYKLGIEYNGLYWHSEDCGKDKFYHLNKTEEMNKNGYGLIHIFEDEYKFKKNIVLSKLKHMLKLDINLPNIMGRKCVIKEITHNESILFLNENHIQGGANATIHIGAFENDKLVAVMLFKRERNGSDIWELNRYASDIKYKSQGVASKLFSYFVKTYNPSLIKSFADRRWTINAENNLYTKLGFQLDNILEPDYKYFSNKTKAERIHKFNFRKGILSKKYGLPVEMTEKNMVKELGFLRVWDCGLFKYVWKKTQK